MTALRITTLVVLATLAVGLFGWATVAGARIGEIMGVIVRRGDASIDVSDQIGVKQKLKVARVMAPADSWVVVHLDEDGMPGERIGVSKVKSGESRDVEVTLDPSVKLTQKVLVAVHIDRGARNKFEFEMDSKESSPDKPYFVDGKEVAMGVDVAEPSMKTKSDDKTPEMK